MKIKLFIIATCILLCGITEYGLSQQYFPEKNYWENKKPEDVGMNEKLLQKAIQYAQQNASKADKNLKKAHYQSAFGREPFGYPIGPMKQRGKPTGLVIKNGYIIAEWGEPERVDLTFSVAKSLVSATVGLGYDQGLIKSENDLVYPYMAPIIPYSSLQAQRNKADNLEEEDVFELFNTEHNRKITWDHLLRQTSDWEGTLWGKPDWADRPEKDSENWIDRERNEPGSVYEYNDTRVNVLALASMNIWRKALPVVLKENLMDKIGASDTWRWTGYENSFVIIDGQILQAVSGGSHWGGGMFINAYDQARFGLLTLKNGAWNGKQILSEEWIKKSLTPTSAQPTYGFMNYFLNTDKSLLPDAPESAFYHLGAGVNMIYVDKENDLVVVTRWLEGPHMNGFIKKVLESLNN
ncbi:serine hydrolase domain-containing protein [Litoribacter populi]|uniref:serine hydrolase domain-containing protein n=1 Tax=Litoribacter populi TaxID=2598460 RepID=UPI00118010B2|nr:serine hydrolase [Litoribacter populi]